MELKKFSEIKNYKSFVDYKWDNFFKGSTFNKINFIYGENGSGKSSLVNIIKSVSSLKDFEKTVPEKVTLKINNNEYVFQNSNWNNKINKKHVVIFDYDFVKENVHVAKERTSTQDGPEQKSSKLIIEFDKEAIRLRKEKEELKKALDEAKQNILEFEKQNKEVLDITINKELYDKYKNLETDQIKKKINELEKIIQKVKDDIKKDEIAKTKSQEILKIDDEKKFQLPKLGRLSNKETYQQLFSFNIEEKTKKETEDELIKKIKQEKEFFKRGIEIFQQDSTKCPFCQSPNVIEDVKHIINLYHRIFDDTYKKALEEFKKQKQALIDELNSIKKFKEDLAAKIKDIFIYLKELEEKFHIPNIYSTEEEKIFTNLPTIDYIIQQIDNIENLAPTTKKYNDFNYNQIEKEYNQIKNFFQRLNHLIKKKKDIIKTYKEEHTDNKIFSRIQTNKNKLKKLNEELTFLKENNIDKYKKKEALLNELEKLIPKHLK